MSNQQLSVQGEQQAAVQANLWATEAEVQAYIEKVSDEVLECRERGRHLFPGIRRGMTFNAVDQATGLMVRRVGCVVCQYPEGHVLAGMPRVVRVELWDVRHNRGVVTRCTLSKAYTAYRDPSYLGQKGKGRMKPKQIRNELGTQMFKGQRFVALRKEVMGALSGGSQPVTIDDMNVIETA